MKNLKSKKTSGILMIFIGSLTLILYACSSGQHSNTQYLLNPSTAEINNTPWIDLGINGEERYYQNSKCDTIIMRDSSTIICVIVSKTKKEVKAIDCPNTGNRVILLRNDIFSINGILEKKRNERQ